jgi:TRAP transporter TAXI family solute receptor
MLPVQLSPVTLDRRTLLRGAGGIGLLALLSACSTSFADIRLTVAAGSNQGVYYPMGKALGQVWQQHLGLVVEPQVKITAGSGENLALLASGAADVAFSQVDAASEALRTTSPDDMRAPRALARVYDEFVHVVVARDAPMQRLAELRGKRVSIGAIDSGVIVVAKRLLEVAGLSATSDLHAVNLGLDASVAALGEGRIDAFFWTGGLPTRGITDLAAARPIRLLDLG